MELYRKIILFILLTLAWDSSPSLLHDDDVEGELPGIKAFEDSQDEMMRCSIEYAFAS